MLFVSSKMLRLFPLRDSWPFFNQLIFLPQKITAISCYSSSCISHFAICCITCHSSQISKCVFLQLPPRDATTNQETMIQRSLEVVLVQCRLKQNKKTMIYKTSKTHNRYYSNVGAWLQNLDKCIKKPQVPSKQQLAIATIKDTMQMAPLNFLCFIKSTFSSPPYLSGY